MLSLGAGYANWQILRDSGVDFGVKQGNMELKGGKLLDD